MRRGITARTKHYDGIRGKTQNESLDARRAQHDAALLEMDVHGRSFGDCSLTLVLHHPDPARVERAAADARKLLAIREGVLLEETYNMLYAWVAIVPGNGAYNLRRLPLLDTHAADLAFVFAPDHGHRDAAVAVLEARHGALYHYALHCEDVGHTLVLGKTGSGKSFLLNFLILHLQQRDPHTVIFDLGHSYRTLTGQLGGSYVELGRQGTVTINPFALPATPENFHFLHAFCRVLIDGEDGFRITASDDHDLYASIVRLYAQPHDGRRLRDLDVPRRLYDRLEPWVRAGRWAETFDNLEDTLDLADLQVFEFEGMQMYPQLVEAVVFYILHRLNAKLQERRRLTVCVMDEAWRFIKHPKLRDYVEEALKTWRKMNGSMILATQAVEDFLASDLQRTVIESCHTKLLLANPDLSREAYATALSLNETELDLVTGLIPKRQVLLKRASTTKVLNVHVDPMSAALFAAKGLSHATAS
jgi:type IV secretion system protein VirB4